MKKKLGQNFLRNKDISKRIVDLSNIPNDVEVIEIGPGDGALTQILLPAVKDMISVEVDPLLIDKLYGRGFLYCV